MPIKKIANVEFSEDGLKYTFYRSPDPKKNVALNALFGLSTMLCANSGYLAGSTLKKSIRDPKTQTSLVDVSHQLVGPTGDFFSGSITFKTPASKQQFDTWMVSILEGEQKYIDKDYIATFAQLSPLMASTKPSAAATVHRPLVVLHPLTAHKAPAPSTTSPARTGPSITESGKLIVFNNIDFKNLDALMGHLYSYLTNAKVQAFVLVNTGGKLSIRPKDPEASFTAKEKSSIASYTPPPTKRLGM